MDTYLTEERRETDPYAANATLTVSLILVDSEAIDQVRRRFIMERRGELKIEAILQEGKSMMRVIEFLNALGIAGEI